MRQLQGWHVLVSIVGLVIVSYTLGFTVTSNAQSGETPLSIKVANETRDNPASIALSTEKELIIVENIGQFPSEVLYQIENDNHTMWLTQDAIWMTVVQQDSNMLANNHPSKGVAIKINFVGANSRAAVKANYQLNTKFNYFIGNNADEWRINVPTWQEVRYVELYPNLDLVISEKEGQLSPQFICKLDCDNSLGQVKLRFEGIEELDLRNEQFGLYTDLGFVSFPLFTISNTKGEQQEPLSSPVFEGNEVSAPFGIYEFPDLQHDYFPPLDNPEDRIYELQLGGSSSEFGSSIAVDEEGNAYYGGWTWSADFPTSPGTYDPTYNGMNDAFVVKVSPIGTIIYATILGGSEAECYHTDWSKEICSLDIDDEGNVYVTGSTNSDDFPVTTGSVVEGGFVSKLNPSGNSLIYSVIVPDAFTTDIEVDSQNRAYITGYAQSNFPPTFNAYDVTFNGVDDAFVARLEPSGTSLSFGTFIGGTGSDYGTSIKLDSQDNSYITGATASNNFPTTSGAYDVVCGTASNCSDANPDAFVAKINSTGTLLGYSTFLGGDGEDRGEGVSLRNDGGVYITGYTYGEVPTTVGAYDPTDNPYQDGFILGLDSLGHNLTYGTYIGAQNAEYGHSIDLDEAGNIYIVGRADSPNIPVTANGYDTTYNGQYDGFLLKLDATGSVILYGSFVGSGENDFGFSHSVAVGPDNTIYVSGEFGYTTSWANVLRLYGGIDPQATPTPTNTSTATNTPPPGATFTPTSTWTPTPTTSNTPLPNATFTPTSTWTPTPTVSNTPPPGATFTSTSTVTPSPSITNTPPPGATLTPTSLPNAAVFVPLVLRQYALATPAPTLTPVPTCNSIDQEPNNFFSQANANLPLCEGGTVSGSVSFSDIDDFYRVQLDNTATVRIDLTGIPIGADYDLYLYDASGGPVTVSNNSGSVSEAIRTQLPSGRYYIRVYSLNYAEPNTYQLRWARE